MAPFELKLSDPPPSRHARPIGERIKEIRRKWDVIRIMMNSRRHRRWLHPVTRQLAARLLKPPRTFKPTVSQKLVKKYQHFRMPIHRPFQCEKCRLSSHNFYTISTHICRKRKRRPMTNDEIEKAILLGNKSGIKNGLRALESADDPNSFLIEGLDCRLHKNTFSNKKFSSSVPPEFKVSQPNKPSTSYKVQNFNPSNKQKKIGYLCLNCKEQFRNYTDYDAHLNVKEECTKKRNDMQIAFFNQKFPLNLTPPPPSKTINLRCIQCKTDFADMVMLQKHVIQCALQR